MIKFEITHINYGPAKPYQVMNEGDEEKWAAHIADQARKGAALGKNCGKMCSDCAFKHPQPPTQDYYNAVDGAIKVILMGGRFNCHTEDHEDAGRECVGMRMAKLYQDTLDE